jgi:hypothetical protein
VRRHQLRDAHLESCDIRTQRRQLSHQCAGDQSACFQHRRILGSRCGLIDCRDALLGLFCGTAVVLLKELAQRPGMRSLQPRQIRPAFQQGPYQWAGHVIKPAENLWKIQFQAVGETMTLARFVIHRPPAFLH